MAKFVALRVADCIGADYSNFALLDRSDLRTIRLFHSDFLDGSVADRYSEFDIDARFPIAVAVRTGRIVSLSGKGDYAEHFPELWADTEAAGITATISLPLIRADGSTIGALGFAWAIRPTFDLSLDKALHALAELCREIVERAEIYQAEHQLIADLHLRLLSDVPTLSGLKTAARYLPSDSSSFVGGDWYEGIALDNDRLALVVGDVVGHGLPAAADMAILRGMITALLVDGVAVADVFHRLTRVLARRHESIYASAALVIIDRAQSTLTYATAGHPPPLLIDAAGSVTLLDAANGPWLGVSPSGSTEVIVPFPIGTQLVMYTDGLVERRNRTFDEGISVMIGLLSSVHPVDDPEKLVDLVVNALVGGTNQLDDVAVLIAKSVTSN